MFCETSYNKVFSVLFSYWRAKPHNETRGCPKVPIALENGQGVGAGLPNGTALARATLQARPMTEKRASSCKTVHLQHSPLRLGHRPPDAERREDHDLRSGASRGQSVPVEKSVLVVRKRNSLWIMCNNPHWRTVPHVPRLPADLGTGRGLDGRNGGYFPGASGRANLASSTGTFC
jgi:hypothetical protein